MSELPEPPGSDDAVGLVDVLLRDPDQLRAACRTAGLDVRVAAMLAERVRESLSTNRSDALGWRQYAVPVETAEQVERFFAGRLARLTRTWAAGTPALDWFFLRKPPGLLVRVRTTVAGSDAVQAALGRAVGEPVLGPDHLPPYQPETLLLGGPAGAELAHAFYRLDSQAVLDFHAHLLEPAAGLGAVEFSLSVLLSTFARLSLDSWEHWDVWARVRDLCSGPDRADLAVRPDAGNAEAARTWAGAAFEQAQQGPLAGPGPEFGRGLDDLAEQARAVAPELTLHLRAVLPFWALTHWNRMGFDAVSQRLIAELIAGVADPHRPARPR